MNEAPVVMFTNYKRVDGFEISLTFRGEDIAQVAKDLDRAITAIKEKGGTPISKNFTKSDTKPSGGMCKVHEVEMKLNKNGTPYHTKGKFPDLTYCNGRGWPTDIGKEVDESFGKDEVNF